MHPQDAPPIPPGSPLATGWRAQAVALLAAHGLVNMMDVISAYAELCVRREPDSSIDPLDCEATVLRMADPAFRRIDRVAEQLAGRQPSHISGGKKSLKTRRRVPGKVGRPSDAVIFADEEMLAVV
jgi:hypothetical protein